jgi:hypothetical protein
MKNIAMALAAAQMMMGKALKQNTNPAFKAKYADLGSVMDACLPALNANGIAVIQPFFDDESGRYIKTIFIHGESGEHMECRVPLITSKNDMQGFGSAATYARRYGLMAMAGIAPEDDDGNAASKASPKSDAASQPVTPEMIERAMEYLYSSDSLDNLKERWSRVPENIKHLEKVIAAKDAIKTKFSNPIDDEIPY